MRQGFSLFHKAHLSLRSSVYSSLMDFAATGFELTMETFSSPRRVLADQQTCFHYKLWTFNARNLFSQWRCSTQLSF